MSSPVQFSLPGWRSTLDIAPMRHAIDLQGSIKLHGALHLCANVGHDLERSQCQKPLIVLIPRDPSGDAWASDRWDAHWLTGDARKLEGKILPVELFGAIRRVTVGEFHEVKVAIPSTDARVSIESLTPMVLKRTDGSFARHLSPGDWIGAAHQSACRFLGSQMSKLCFRDASFDLAGWECCKVSVDTRWSGQPITAFLWRCQVSANASGLLALRVLEQLGIGATVSRGYGRFHLNDKGVPERQDSRRQSPSYRGE